MFSSLVSRSLILLGKIYVVNNILSAQGPFIRYYKGGMQKYCFTSAKILQLCLHIAMWVCEFPFAPRL